MEMLNMVEIKTKNYIVDSVGVSPDTVAGDRKIVSDSKKTEVSNNRVNSGCKSCTRKKQ